MHVGDSRAYLMRDGELRQLTRDHSLVEELRRQGRLTSEEAEDHPQRSVVTRALGVEPDVELDVHTHQARSGDLFLLCSDGLTSMVRQDRMREIVVGSDSLRTAADRLVTEANEMGGRDNITVVHVSPRGRRAGRRRAGWSRPWSARRRSKPDTDTHEVVAAPAEPPAERRRVRRPSAAGRRPARGAQASLHLQALRGPGGGAGGAGGGYVRGDRRSAAACTSWVRTIAGS